MIASGSGSTETWEKLENVAFRKFEDDNWKIHRAVMMMRDEGCRDITQLTATIDPNSGLLVEFFLSLVTRFEREFAANPAASAEAAATEGVRAVSSVGSGGGGGSGPPEATHVLDAATAAAAPTAAALGDGGETLLGETLLRTLLTGAYGDDTVAAMGDISALNENHEPCLSPVC